MIRNEKLEVIMKLQEKISATRLVKILMMTCFMLVCICVTNPFTLTAHAQGTAVVAAASGKIRKSADTSSDVLASVKQNDKLDVIAQTSSSDGYTWYKVYVDGTKTGYIRADLVSDVSGSISTESSSGSAASNDTADSDTSDNNTQGEVTTVGSKNSTSTSTTDTNETSADVNVSASTVTAAKVIGSSVRVRETPSTSGTVKGNAKGDTEVTVSGETTDSDGKIWYQISFNSGDSTINGFIRSDFLEVTQTMEPETEVPTEEPTVEEEVIPENNDYELNYEENDEGVQEWFLYDNLKGTKQNLNNIFEIVQQSQDTEARDNDQLKKMKIILIVMAAVILLLVIGITVLLFKVKDSYEYDEDDDEDDEDEDDDEEEYIPVKRRKPAGKPKYQTRRKRYEEYDDDEDDEDEDEDEEEIIRKPAPKKTSVAPKKGDTKDGSWQAKNFLDVDDDMEFEFLDLK